MIYVCEHHDQLLEHWRRQDLRGIRLAHVDFHDDLRGLLIDRGKHEAYAIGRLASGEDPLDAGNFLAHAVLEGRVESVRWVHDLPGGRAYDAGIVRYESDWSAWPARRRQRRDPAPVHRLEFDETLVDDWNGVRSGERLSVDWDCFASIQQEPGGVERRVARFLDRLGPEVPADSYVAFSPEYSRPDLTTFRGFVDRLAERYAQRLEWLSPGLEHGETTPRPLEPDPRTRLRMRAILFLRRCGLY